MRFFRESCKFRTNSRAIATKRHAPPPAPQRSALTAAHPEKASALLKALLDGPAQERGAVQLHGSPARLAGNALRCRLHMPLCKAICIAYFGVKARVVRAARNTAQPSGFCTYWALRSFRQHGLFHGVLATEAAEIGSRDIVGAFAACPPGPARWGKPFP